LSYSPSNSIRLPRIASIALCALAAFSCGGDGSTAKDAGGPDTEFRDAAPTKDGAVVQCQADHQESLEDRNDRIINETNQVEPTGLVLSKKNGFSICGEIDPAQANGDFADVDVFEFNVSGEQELRLQLSVANSQNLRDVGLLLFSADGPSTLAEATLLDGLAITHRVLPEGTYWIAVLAKTPVQGSPVPYRLQVSPRAIECSSPQLKSGTYSESLDGADSRDNDTLRIAYAVSSTFSETPSTTDAPEITSLPLLPGDRSDVVAVAADIDSLDDYRDRDTFVIHTGVETRELSLRLNWDHAAGVDLDLHVFAPGQPETDFSFDGAATVGVGNDELTTMAVLPDTDYWVWVGAFAEASAQPALDYTITMCADSN